MLTQGVVTVAFVVLSVGAPVMTLALVAGTARHRRIERREPVLADARRALVQVAAGEADADAGGRPVTAQVPAGLRGDELVSVLFQVAASVNGVSLAALRAVAERAGVVARARRDLRSPWWSRRLTAARLLTALQAPAGREGARLLRDRKAVVRAQAVVWLSTELNATTAQILIPLLADPDGRCRFAAKDSLVRMGNAAVPLLSQLLAERNPASIEAVLEMAAAVGHPSFANAAERIAENGSPPERALAAGVLGASGDPSSAPVLRVLLADPEPRVRAAAATAVAALGDWPAAAAVADLLHDDSWPVRRDAGLALLRLSAPGLVLLREAARAGDRAGDVATRVLHYAEITAAGAAQPEGVVT